MPISEMTDFTPRIPPWFNVRKASQVVAFFALREGGSINILKLVKLIYLADRQSLADRERPITGDEFIAMRFGPVNSITYDFAKGAANERRAEWSEFVGERRGHDITVKDGVTAEDLDELSRYEARVLSGIWMRFKDIERFQLAEWTHRYCPEWRDPGTSSVEISYADVFKVLGKAEPDELAAEITQDRERSTLMSSH